MIKIVDVWLVENLQRCHAALLIYVEFRVTDTVQSPVPVILANRDV